MEQTPLARLKMLIVDDEPDNLDLLYRTFRLKFQVLRAESAMAALDLLDRHGEVAIIISDQRMPEMLGTEFLGKTVEQFPDTIRIVLTAYTDVKDLVDAINSGKVFKYITKPWNQQQLQGVVQQAAETYRVVKQRTEELRRSLRRESLFNSVTTALRESLDYRGMLQTLVATLADTFAVDSSLLTSIENGQPLYPAVLHRQPDFVADPTFQEQEASIPQKILQAYDLLQPEVQTMQRSLQGPNGEDRTCVVVPFIYQNDLLALLSLYRESQEQAWSQEDIELLEDVAEQAALALSQAKLYQRSQQQAEQIRGELAVARQIQNNLLRQTMPQVEGIQIQACCHPAREVGGDFFEVYQHPQGDLWLAVGDVSGKGVPAALFMASAISVLRRELAQEISPEPEEVLHNLNSTLLDDLVSTNCFITMVLARYRPQPHQITYANAGHLYPMLWSRHPQIAMQEPRYLKIRGVPLGILSVWRAASETLPLQSGDIFLLTSDGVTEATVREQDQLPGCTTVTRNSEIFLQQTGLWKLLSQEQQSLDLKNLLVRIREKTVAQEDDQTMLSLEVL
ncbi:MAG: SpoIIE family protein phosphatase [Synechococcales bacterium]|nr:SpoIIE family protein phosphatase [Synechococcales bacterium]